MTETAIAPVGNNEAVMHPNKERRALLRFLAMPGWYDGLPDNTKRAVMGKVLAALNEAKSARDIGSITRALAMLERNDAIRAQLELDQGRTDRPGITINGPVQINAGTPLAKLLESDHVADLACSILERGPGNPDQAQPAGPGDDGPRQGKPTTLGLAEQDAGGNGKGNGH